MREDLEDNESTDENACTRCGMTRDQWTANQGQGILQDGELYCCAGCAEETGCTCEEDREEVDPSLRGSASEDYSMPGKRGRKKRTPT